MNLLIFNNYTILKSFYISYIGSTKNKGWSYSTGVASSTKTLTIFPLTSDSIWLKSFIASITQTIFPADTSSLYLAKAFYKKYQSLAIL